MTRSILEVETDISLVDAEISSAKKDLDLAKANRDASLGAYRPELDALRKRKVIASKKTATPLEMFYAMQRDSIAKKHVNITAEIITEEWENLEDIVKNQFIATFKRS